MIFEKVIGNLNDLDDLSNYEIEYLEIPHELLAKDLLRVTSNKKNEYGVSIDHKKTPLQNGDIFFNEGNKIVALSVLPTKMIVIKPNNIDEMGTIAHLLGNSHKPVLIENGQIILEIDPVVENILKERNIDYQIKEIILNKSLKHVNLSHHHHES